MHDNSVGVSAPCRGLPSECLSTKQPTEAQPVSLTLSTENGAGRKTDATEVFAAKEAAGKDKDEDEDSIDDDLDGALRGIGEPRRPLTEEENRELEEVLQKEKEAEGKRKNEEKEEQNPQREREPRRDARGKKGSVPAGRAAGSHEQSGSAWSNMSFGTSQKTSACLSAMLLKT